MEPPLPPHALARHGDLAWRVGGVILDLSVAPSGRRVAVTSRERLYVFDAVDGAVIASPLAGVAPSYEVRRATLLDDDTVLVSSGFKTADVWSLAEGRTLRSAEVTVGGSYDYPVSAVGMRAVIPQSDGAWALWNLATAERFGQLEGLAPWGLARAALSYDGTRLATSHARELALWDVATGQKLTSRPHEVGVTPTVEFSRDGRRLVTSTINNGLAVWNLDADTLTTLPVQGLYPKLRFSPDGATLAMLRSDVELTMWSLAEMRRVSVRALGPYGWMGGLEYLPDGTLMLGVAGGVQRLDGVTGERTGGYDPVTAEVRAVTFVGRGGDVETRHAARREVWSLDSGATVSETAHAIAPEPTTFSVSTDDGAFTLSTEGLHQRHGLGPLSLHARGERAPRWTGPSTSYCNALAIARDGSAAAFAFGGRVAMLDGATGEAKERVVLKLAVTAIALSADGALLAVGDERGTVSVYVRPGRKAKLAMTGHVGPVTALAFRDDGRLLASGSGEGTTLVWDVAGALTPPRKTRKKAT